MIRSLFAKQNCLTSILTNDFAGTLLHRVPASIIIIPLFLKKVKRSIVISQIFTIFRCLKIRLFMYFSINKRLLGRYYYLNM